MIKSADSKYANLSHGLLLDVRTRWNSTHDTIVAALDFKDIFENFYGRRMMDGTGNRVQLESITEEQWGKLKIIGDYLRPSKDLTVELSRHISPTSNLVLSAIHTLITRLEDPVFDTVPTTAQFSDIEQDMYNFDPTTLPVDTNDIDLAHDVDGSAVHTENEVQTNDIDATPVTPHVSVTHDAGVKMLD